MNHQEEFESEKQARIEAYANDVEMRRSSMDWFTVSLARKYSYNFTWLGRPIIQYPQDMVALQEIIWRVQPDLIIETGIAHGGSLIFSASMLALLDLNEGAPGGTVSVRRLVLGLDIDIRAHNHAAIHAHPLSSKIKMIQGSSVDPEVIAQVRVVAQGKSRILLCLDSNHSQEHVKKELEAYAPLVSPGSYCIVYDTYIEDMPAGYVFEKSWGHGNNPRNAVESFLKEHGEFSVDHSIHNKLQLTVAPHGYLKRL
jgi:cephalosporin hydroxylase